MFDLIDFWVCLSIHNIYIKQSARIRYPVSKQKQPQNQTQSSPPKPKPKPPTTQNPKSPYQPIPATHHKNPTTQPHSTTNTQNPATILPIPKILLFTKPPTPTQSLHPPQKPHYPQYCKVGRENPKNSRRCGVGDFAQKPTLNQYL